MINIDIVFLTLLATNITAESTNKEPKLAAIANPILENAIEAKIPENAEKLNTKKATPKLAPELIPNTNGPANGFLKRVCINKPHIDKPDPTSIAVIALGNL